MARYSRVPSSCDRKDSSDEETRSQEWTGRIQEKCTCAAFLHGHAYRGLLVHVLVGKQSTKIVAPRSWKSCSGRASDVSLGAYWSSWLVYGGIKRVCLCNISLVVALELLWFVRTILGIRKWAVIQSIG